MARLFDGISNSLQSASTINLTAYAKIALAFWLYWDVYSTNADIALELGTTDADTDNGFLIIPNASGGEVFIAHYGNAGASQGNIPQPSAAAWHHLVVNMDRSLAINEVDTVYVDGVSQVLNRVSNNNNTDTFPNTTLNVMSRANSSLFGAGRMAELAIWGGGLLSQADATALAAATKLPSDASLSIGAATHYWKICGDNSPEPATLGGIALTVNGATQTAHPPAVAASCLAAGFAGPYNPRIMVV
jgi:hypothetical protein